MVVSEGGAEPTDDNVEHEPRTKCDPGPLSDTDDALPGHSHTPRIRTRAGQEYRSFIAANAFSCIPRVVLAYSDNVVATSE